MDPSQKISGFPQSESLSTTERLVAALWSEVLQTPDPPGATDDFFAIGGDSMTMVMAEFRIMEEFSVQLPPGSVLGAPTVRELSALIETKLIETKRNAAQNSDTPAAASTAC